MTNSISPNNAKGLAVDLESLRALAPTRVIKAENCWKKVSGMSREHGPGRDERVAKRLPWRTRP
jgi:hypothetical protein